MKRLSPDEIAELGWNLLKEDLSLPCAVLYEDKLRHNLEWMRQFIQRVRRAACAARQDNDGAAVVSDATGVGRVGDHAGDGASDATWHGGMECGGF